MSTTKWWVSWVPENTHNRQFLGRINGCPFMSHRVNNFQPFNDILLGRTCEITTVKLFDLQKCNFMWFNLVLDKLLSHTMWVDPQNTFSLAWVCNPVVEYLPRIHDALGVTPSTEKKNPLKLGRYPQLCLTHKDSQVPTEWPVTCSRLQSEQLELLGLTWDSSHSWLWLLQPHLLKTYAGKLQGVEIALAVTYSAITFKMFVP
jgi:hypothetical protein